MVRLSLTAYKWEWDSNHHQHGMDSELGPRETISAASTIAEFKAAKHHDC
jgi:hypothetical protein